MARWQAEQATAHGKHNPGQSAVDKLVTFPPLLLVIAQSGHRRRTARFVDPRNRGWIGWQMHFYYTTSRQTRQQYSTKLGNAGTCHSNC